MDAILIQLLELGNFLPEDKKAEQVMLVKQMADDLNIALDINGGNVSEELRDEQEIISSWRREKELEKQREDEQAAAAEAEQQRQIAEEKRRQKAEQEKRDKEQREREQRERDAAAAAKPAAATRSVDAKPSPARSPSSKPSTAASAAATPAGGDCDLSDPDVQAVAQLVRDDSQPIAWFVLGYGTERRKLQVYGKGEGGINELKACIAEHPKEIQFALIRLVYGDSDRSKFVFITFVPESLSGMAKAKANMHKPYVDVFMQYFHTYLSANSLDDITEPIVYDKLTRASGANYGTGRNFSSMKGQSKNFFSETEKQGNVAGVVYDQGPIKAGLTDSNLAARPGLTIDSYRK